MATKKEIYITFWDNIVETVCSLATSREDLERRLGELLDDAMSEGYVPQKVQEWGVLDLTDR